MREDEREEESKKSSRGMSSMCGKTTKGTAKEEAGMSY